MSLYGYQLTWVSQAKEFVVCQQVNSEGDR